LATQAVVVTGQVHTELAFLNDGLLPLAKGGVGIVVVGPAVAGLLHIPQVQVVLGDAGGQLFEFAFGEAEAAVVALARFALGPLDELRDGCVLLARPVLQRRRRRGRSDQGRADRAVRLAVRA